MTINTGRTQRVLFLGRRDNISCEKALAFCRNAFSEVVVALGGRGDSLPLEALEWSGDYILSFLNPWILSKEMLGRAKKGAINFHPGPPEYPGSGVTNFALYDQVIEFGVTCHHMNQGIDEGQIIKVLRFATLENDTVESLMTRSHDHLTVLFYDVIGSVLKGGDLPEASVGWSRKAYQLAEVDTLATLDYSMSSEEIRRRVRATSFRQWLPKIKIGDDYYSLGPIKPS